ncbi:MAG: hypothetical protein MK132_02535 [Lentisphaerales bacterium]|nr:hypothetical protein [Lentisphaerales bacterium]
MLSEKILAFTSALLISGSLIAQLEINEAEKSEVKNVIEVAGPQEDGEAKRAKADDLKFISGDYFKGSLVSITEEGLKWSHSEAKSEIVFRPDNLDKLSFGHIPVSLRRSGVTDITLTNGDKLFGLIDQLNEDYLVLDTWYAGKLQIERPMIQAIHSGGGESKAIFEGPNSLDEWQVANRGSWSFKDDYLYNTRQYGGVGKDVKLPDKSNLEFTISWKSRLNFQVHFYTDRVHSSGGNCYQLVMNNRYCYVQRYSNHEGSDQLGSFNLSSLNDKFKVSIRTDKEKKSILILIDDKVVKQINDPSNFAGKGTGVLFYSHQGDIRLSNIRVNQWNGAVGNTAKQEIKSKDSILFVNKDSVTGELKTIKDGKVVFDTPFAPLTIPIGRISSIVLGEEGYEKPRRNAGDVEGFFANGAGRLTLKLKSFVEGKVNGSSENFGDGAFDVRAFEKVFFNIYTDKKKSGEEQGDW